MNDVKAEIVYPGWNIYNKGQTIGTMGCEGGIIILDMECIMGGRLTLEHSTSIAPFAITFGIYSLMFHTHYCGTYTEAKEYIEKTFAKIDEAFSLYDIPESKRDAAWAEMHDKLLVELTK